MAIPDATFIPCREFGGGWIVANSSAGRGYFEDWFLGPASFLPPIGQEGWIVEPQDLRDLVECVRDSAIKLELDS